MFIRLMKNALAATYCSAVGTLALIGLLFTGVGDGKLAESLDNNVLAVCRQPKTHAVVSDDHIALYVSRKNLFHQTVTSGWH